MVYVSVRGRIWLQAEAANMVESVGNYVKHRRVPVMVKEGGNYLTFFVPAISGESIAHAYQVVLAEELKKLNENVCPLCEKGIFLKSTNAEVYNMVTKSEPPKKTEKKGQKSGQKQEETEKEVEENAEKEIEEKIVANCGVEDIGGFLYAGNPNVKRTSSFFTGYMIPVREVLKATSIDPQLHSRYALGTKFVSMSEGGSSSGQMVYYVEVSSALFTFSFDLDTRFIGKHTFHVDSYGQLINGLKNENVKNRAIAALNALQRLLIEFPIGAKRTRFNPADLSWESVAIAVSGDVFTLPSSFTKDYMARGIQKKAKVSFETKIYGYSDEGCASTVGDVRCGSTPEEAITEAIKDAKGRI